MKKLVISLALVAGVLTGCGDKIQTVDYYRTHESEMNSVRDKCAHTQNKDENCANADTAYRELWSNAMKNFKTDL